MRVQVHGYNHVAIEADDVEKAVAFYRKSQRRQLGQFCSGWDRLNRVKDIRLSRYSPEVLETGRAQLGL